MLPSGSRTMRRQQSPQLTKYDATLTYPQVWVSVANEIAYVHSDFYNGAASTAQCERLTAAIREAARISGSNDGGVKAVLLMGGEHSYGNGINLNTIEASEDPEMVRRGGGSKGSILRYSTPHFDVPHVSRRITNRAFSSNFCMAPATSKLCSLENYYVELGEAPLMRIVPYNARNHRTHAPFFARPTAVHFCRKTDRPFLLPCIGILAKHQRDQRHHTRDVLHERQGGGKRHARQRRGRRRDGGNGFRPGVGAREHHHQSSLQGGDEDEDA